MYSGNDAVSMFNCVPSTCDVFRWGCCFYVQLCPFHLWSTLVMMLFLCSIVFLSFVMYSSDDAISMFNCVPFTCDVFLWWCCFYIQLCPFHLWCILVIMLFLCLIVSLSLVMYSGGDPISMFNCVPSTCDVFWWGCCFYVQLCPFHLLYSGRCCFYIQLCPICDVF